MTNQLAVTSPAVIPMAELQTMADAVSGSQMFGVRSPAQAMALMLLCQAEGMHPMLALRRYHIVDGKPSMRADAMQGEFEARGGGILWHIRTDSTVAATLFSDAKTMSNAKAIERAKLRVQAIIDGDTKTVMEHAHPGEETIVRTIEDADAKKVSMSYDKDKKEWRKKHNWIQSPRQMLTARVITEGVRLIAPGLIAGIYTPDEIEDIPEMEVVTSDRQENARLGVEAAIDVRTGDVRDTDDRVRTDVAEIVKGNAMRDWESIVCHIGNAEGPILGKTVSEIFGPEVKTKRARALMDWWKEKVVPNLSQQRDNKSVALLAAVQCAEDALKTREEADSAPDTPKDDQNADNANLAQPSASNEAKPEPTLEVAAEVTQKPAPEKSAKKAKPETLDWRNVTVPFECSLKGQKLMALQDHSNQSFTWTDLFHAIKKHLIDNPAKFKSVPAKEANKFKAAYEIAAVEMCLGRSPQEVNNKIRDLCSDMVISNETQVAHAEALGIIPKLGAKTWEKHEPESIQNVIRMWPDFAQSVRDNFEKEGK